jgi:hypothetical protein
MTPFITTGLLPLLLCAAHATAATPLQDASPTHASSASVVQLKRQYLICDDAATQRMLGSGEAAWCSVTSERLLREGFGGDFNALLAWWREAKPAFGAARRKSLGSGTSGDYSDSRSQSMR